METPESKSEDIVRAVRAVFNSLTKLLITGNLIRVKSIYFSINLARKVKYNPKPTTNTITKVNSKFLEKKLPKKIKTRVERGNVTPSSLKVFAKAGTTKANIKIPITTIADIMTPG